MKDRFFNIVSVLLVFVAFAVFPIYSLYAEPPDPNTKNKPYKYKLFFEKSVINADKKTSISFRLLHPKCVDDVNRYKKNYEIPIYDELAIEKLVVVLQRVGQDVGGRLPTDILMNITVERDGGEGINEKIEKNIKQVLITTERMNEIFEMDLIVDYQENNPAEIGINIETSSSIFESCETNIYATLVATCSQPDN